MAQNSGHTMMRSEKQRSVDSAARQRWRRHIRVVGAGLVGAVCAGVCATDGPPAAG
eukprot:COSAG06_NODE_18534_length_882_cov_4.934866_2_plen_55_part_01